MDGSYIIVSGEQFGIRKAKADEIIHQKMVYTALKSLAIIPRMDNIDQPNNFSILRVAHLL